MYRYHPPRGWPELCAIFPVRNVRVWFLLRSYRSKIIDFYICFLTMVIVTRYTFSHLMDCSLPSLIYDYPSPF